MEANTATGNTELETLIFTTYNPFRYRGYYYDIETGLYYLQSRYYNPEWGRFLNADDMSVTTATPMGLTDKNLFIYCDNNPITRKDDGGEFWHTFFSAVSLGRVITRLNTLQYSNNKNGKSAFLKANSVVRVHRTKSLIENPALAWSIGNLSYTATVSLNEAETFYSFSDTGEDERKVGIGMNWGNWYGAEAYVTSDIGFGSSWQLTPWITGSYGWSLKSGLSYSLGIIIDDTTHEITISVGNGALLGQALYAGMGTVSARTFKEIVGFLS